MPRSSPSSFRTSLSSRERNRIHARKTRQRKKEQLQTLQSRANELKEEQIRLQQIINDKNTARILVGLFATSKNQPTTNDGEYNTHPERKDDHPSTTSLTLQDPVGPEDPQVEALLRRKVEDIPDSSRISELPSLILPGQHASKKLKEQAIDPTSSSHLLSHDAAATSSDDGIDYELLGKDRSKCTKEELDRIRRERNRMHAKRTRDRKRLFLEELGELCRQLQEENLLLRNHLQRLDPHHQELTKGRYHGTTSTIVEGEQHASTVSSLSSSPHMSPTLVSTPGVRPLFPRLGLNDDESHQGRLYPAPSSSTTVTKSGVTSDQISTLLKAATSFDPALVPALNTSAPAPKRPHSTIVASAVSSDDSNDDEEVRQDESSRIAKRRRTPSARVLGI